MPPVVETLQGVKALTFDVFGTVVDWRSTIHSELIRRARDKIASPTFTGLAETLQSRFRGISDGSWGVFAQEWRDSYIEFAWAFVPGEMEWEDIDAHFYDSLKELLQKWDVTGVYADEEIRSLSLTWHYLRPWDDSPLGIQRLGTRYVTATLSNGNRALLEDLNAHGSLGFARIISTADFGAYKPHPSTYLGAVNALECRPNEVAMVAAHLGDLHAARANGLRTIYVERDREEAWSHDDERWTEAREWVDLTSDLRPSGLRRTAHPAKKDPTRPRNAFSTVHKTTLDLEALTLLFSSSPHHSTTQLSSLSLPPQTTPHAVSETFAIAVVTAAVVVVVITIAVTVAVAVAVLVATTAAIISFSYADHNTLAP
ncbi:hypothetical protein NUW58_g7213 [Xylaria curta]|uniref:Uncharacterized protein n=1 Tax=Xylaria curta TaxID=42375 RepID=A0ACC1NJE9_9PEZI|nr:hypothetical protein NUW58_g7213 [Xylaria curta]